MMGILNSSIISINGSSIDFSERLLKIIFFPVCLSVIFVFKIVPDAVSSCINSYSTKLVLSTVFYHLFSYYLVKNIIRFNIIRLET